MNAVLTYHSIDPSGSAISVSPEAFDRHMAWLTSGRVRPMTLAELVARSAESGDAVAVTFDDGFANTEGPVARLLDAGVPVTVFAVTRHVGGTNAWRGVEQAGIPTMPLLDWAALERIAARGAAIEAHTRTHPVLVGLPEAAVDEELRGSADDLQERLGVAPGRLAYPYGAVDDRVAAIAARRFGHGFTTEFDVLGGGLRPMWCPRLDMYYLQSPSALDRWGTPAFRRRAAWIRARRAVRRRLTAFGSTRGG